MGLFKFVLDYLHLSTLLGGPSYPIPSKISAIKLSIRNIHMDGGGPLLNIISIFREQLWTGTVTKSITATLTAFVLNVTNFSKVSHFMKMSILFGTWNIFVSENG